MRSSTLVEEATGQVHLHGLGMRHDGLDEFVRVEVEVRRIGVDVGHVEQSAAAGTLQHFRDEVGF